MIELRWGILGTGGMGELFANALSSVRGAVLHGVASRTRGRADAFAARFAMRRAYHAYDELLQDPAVDIVYVATRNEHHCEDSIAAIQAGKAVLCEKPFALNADAGRNVVAAARRQGVFCMEAMWMRCSPAVRAVIDIVRNGGIGTPTFVSAQLGMPMPFDPQHRVYANVGGGALFDFGVYPLSLTHALLGSPLRVRSLARLSRTGVDEQFAAVLEYASGCQAVIGASLQSKLANTAAICGSTGRVDLLGDLYFPGGYRMTGEAAASNGFAKESNAGLFSIGRRVWSRFSRHRPERGVEKLLRHSIREGYACEAAIVQKCIQSGRLESAEMPLDETIEVLESVDRIHHEWSI